MSCGCGSALCDTCWSKVERGFEFDALTIKQDEANHEKYGDRSTSLLMIVLMEEIGEIAKAILESESSDRIRAEIIDASGVLAGRMPWNPAGQPSLPLQRAIL